MFTDFRFELAGSRHQKLLAEAAERRLARPEPDMAHIEATPTPVSAPRPLVGRIVRRFAGPVGL